MLNSGAAIVATGSSFAVLNQVEYAPGGSVKLIATAGNTAADDVVTINSGANVDVSGAGGGYAGSLTIQSAGATTLNGTLSGGSLYKDTGGNFSLVAGSLSGALPFSSGFTGSFSATLITGNITIAAGTTLTSGNVLLVTNGGSVDVEGTIDASGPTAAPSRSMELARPRRSPT